MRSTRESPAQLGHAVLFGRLSGVGRRMSQILSETQIGAEIDLSIRCGMEDECEVRG